MATATYDQGALDMAADLAEGLTSKELRGVSALIAHISKAPEGDIVILADEIPLADLGGNHVGDIVFAADDTWQFRPVKEPAADEPDEERPARSTARRGR